MNREDFINRTIINLKELIEELESFKDIDLSRMWFTHHGKKTNFDRLRIQSAKDLVKISKGLEL